MARGTECTDVLMYCRLVLGAILSEIASNGKGCDCKGKYLLEAGLMFVLKVDTVELCCTNKSSDKC